MAAPPPPADPAVMIDEIVEKFLLRLPPEDPELLARAALVSRQWYRVVTGPSFRRRFRKLHRSTPPLLGYVTNFFDSVRFVPLLSLRPPGANRQGVQAVSSSHGRVLLHRLSEEDRAPRFPVTDVDVHLSVWHPITNEQQDLPVVPLRPRRGLNMVNWDAAVVCASGDDGCDHLRCHFKVVFVGSRGDRNFSCVYTSEAGSWSEAVFSPEEVRDCFVPGSSVLIGTALYTTCGAATNEVFKYDLETQQMSNVSITLGPRVPPDIIRHTMSRLIAAEDGRLGFAKTSNSTLGLWVTENGRLEEGRDIDLSTLLPADVIPDPMFEYADILSKPWVVAFAATGDGVIFLWTRDGYFTIDLKPQSCKNVGEVSSSSLRVVPYVSFWTPAPAAGVAISSNEVPVASVSTDEGAGAGIVVSADDVLVADIAVSTDGPGAGVAVSADEGPGAGVAVSADEGAGAGVAVSSDEVPVADIVVSTDGGQGAGVAVSADEGPVPKKLKLQVQGPQNQDGNE